LGSRPEGPLRGLPLKYRPEKVTQQIVGTGWGMKGYFTLPYAYLAEENLSDDFWTIRIVE
jgi:hypothetical protein